MMPTLALPGERMPGQFGPIRRVPEIIALERVVDPQLVVRRDPLGDRDHQLDPGRGGLEDRVGRKPRGHEDHRGVRLDALGRLCPAVEHGNALHVLSALARRHPADHVRAVALVVQRVERALAAGDPGDGQARVLVDEDRHQLCSFANATTFSAASFMVLAACTFRQRGLLQQLATGDVVRAVQPHDERDGWFDLIERGDQAFRDLVATGDAPEDVEQHSLDRIVGKDQLDRLLDLRGVRAAAGVEEVRRLAAGLGDDVEGAHHQPGAVAEDPDVAVELDVLHALLLRAALDRVFVLLVGQLLVLGVAVQRVVVERDLRVERLDLALRRHDQRVDLRERRVLVQPHLVQRHQRVGHTLDHVGVGLAVGGDLHGLRAREPLQRVHVMADQLLRECSRRPLRCPRRPRR